MAEDVDLHAAVKTLVRLATTLEFWDCREHEACRQKRALFEQIFQQLGMPIEAPPPVTVQ
jgi:hypothetical protein